MPNFSGKWSLSQQFTAIGQSLWPRIPGAPTIGTATGGNAQASVTFTAPADFTIYSDDNCNFDSNIAITGDIINDVITISANLEVRGFGGVKMKTVKRGIITGVNDQGVDAVFENRQKRHAKFEDLVDIEGMDIIRYAQAYRIKVNPKKKK